MNPRIIVVSGLIGAGKSTVSGCLAERGIPVYDCDSGAKALYRSHPDLAAMATPDIFDRPEALSKLEAALFPVLEADIRQWAERSGREVVAVESATILSKPYFDSFGDWVLWVSASPLTRLERALARGGISEESIRSRMALQKDESENPRVTAVISNEGPLEQLQAQVDDFLNNINFKDTIMANEKTDLARILSVAGYSGLYKYVAQSRSGAIAEGLKDGVRVNFPASGKITTLEDIAIYTDEGEMKLREVFLAMKKVLGTADAPSAKDSADSIKALFEKAVPDYDRDRFYISHMKKVVTWYNELKNFASLDFVNPDEEEAKEV